MLASSMGMASSISWRVAWTEVTASTSRGESLSDVLDRSVNETLPRSVMTHATTLAATLALLFFAGEVIRPFAWVMAFGVFVATFSSIYVAGPLLLWIESKFPRSATDVAGRAVRVVERAGAG